MAARETSGEPHRSFHPSDPPKESKASSSIYRVYATFLLALVFALAAADRNILAILLVPIQKELGVSDLAMGSLAGAAFSIVYATSALPLAVLADRGNRRNIVAVALAVWSTMTAACGATTSFITLLLGRVGVAAGEAAHSSAIMSMLGDLYPRNRRGVAFGFISVGTALGSGAGAALVGAISDQHGWRMAFYVMAVPGLLVAALVRLTMVEPRRGAIEGRPETAWVSSWAAARYILGISTMRRMLCAQIVMQGTTGAFLVWMPAFFIRVHGLTTGQMSARFGLALAAGSAIASVLAGFVTDRLSKLGEKWRLYYCCFALLSGAPFLLLTISLRSTALAFTCLFLSMLMAGGLTATSTVAYLGVIRPDVRGRASALFGFCVSVVGLGFGPSLFGGVNDILKRSYGAQAIHITVFALPVLWVVAALLFRHAGQTADKDSEAALGPDVGLGVNQLPSVSL